MTLTNSNTEQLANGQPDPLNAPGDDSLEEVKITKRDWERVNRALGHISTLQSDRDIAKQTRTDLTALRDDLRPLLERAHTLGTQNKSLDEALAQIQTEQSEQDLRSTMTEILSYIKGGGTLPGGPGKPAGVNLTQVLADYELDPTDTFVAAKLKGQNFKTQEEAEAFVGRIYRDKSKAPNPKTSQEPTTPGQPTNTDEGESVEEMAAEYRTLMKNPKQNRERLKFLGEKLKELEA